MSIFEWLIHLDQPFGHWNDRLIMAKHSRHGIILLVIKNVEQSLVYQHQRIDHLFEMMILFVKQNTLVEYHWKGKSISRLEAFVRNKCFFF